MKTIQLVKTILLALFLSANMLSLHSALTASANTSKNQSAETGSGETDEYKLVWEDLFNNGTLDETNRWSVEVNGNGGGNSELQYYRRENISVGNEPVSGNGCLIIKAKKESFSGKTCTSGRLTTQNKMSIKYGKIEARIKLPKTANGLWPAFWTLGADISSVGWPKCGEIDILEMGNTNGIKNGTQEKYFNGACHWGESWNNGSYPNYAKATTNSYSLQDDFHLYTLIWDENAIKMYLDLDKYPNNTPYFEMAINGEDVAGNARRYFHKQNFVIFNLAIGGNFPQIWDINKITALNANNNYETNMYVDFIRIYQKGATGEELTSKYKTALPNLTESSEYNIFPIPVNDVLNIKSDVIPAQVLVFNINGQLMSSSKNTTKIDTSNLSAGSYILKISNNEGISETFSFTKK